MAGPSKKNIEPYEHKGQERVNNPPVGLVTPETDKSSGKKTYAYDPHLDPQLVWAGKAEHTSFEVPTVSLHVHERIDPRKIIETVRKQDDPAGQLSFFDSATENPPLREAIEFYKHKHDWSNRLIAGDSLLVMNSLIEKEGLAGQVQMIYIDPPYGIKYGSNFQPFVNKRDVTDGKDEDLTQEPEMIKAFRDTWELGVHSYLAYLRDRLLLARELLTDSGSVFVQISDENLHFVRNLLDEVFSPANFCGIVSFQKTGGIQANLLPPTVDYLIWYARDIKQIKYRQLYIDRQAGDPSLDRYDMLLLSDGSTRRISRNEALGISQLPNGSRRYQLTSLLSDGASGEPKETALEWKSKNIPVPPVMITVANTTETAARVKYAFDHKQINIAELCAPDRTLHIDSKVLEMAEAREAPEVKGTAEATDETESPVKKLSKKDLAEQLRRTVDTVGQPGEEGEFIQNVIAVGMLSEGWDTKTVTHIMGLRAFRSQLLCEQVVGRGLRRTAYEADPETGLFNPEYVNIFGVPFTFLPHESTDGGPPDPPAPATIIEPVKEKAAFAIGWPNIIRIDHVYRPVLALDMAAVKALELDAYDTATRAELAPILEGKPDLTKMTDIDLEALGREYRQQKQISEVSARIYEQMKPDWKGNKEYLLGQVIKLVDQFLAADKIHINPPLFAQDELRRRILITLNLNQIVQHIWQAIRFENAQSIVPVFDSDNPIRSTFNMRSWGTRKPCEYTKKSHVNFCVFDSTWEATEAFELDRDSRVAAWVKNDHLGFDVIYIFKGIVRTYRPDFIVKLNNGEFLIIETKGQDSQQDKTKREFLSEWVKAVNGHGGFGHWSWAVSRHPKDVAGLIERAVGLPVS